ncbi:hypothetical protein CPB97_009592 [Podila verticillata]|nr:hypothetical protein CPB97_009592 [Podila verticillata]
MWCRLPCHLAGFKNAGFDTKIWDRFSHIKEHGTTHVTVLTSVIKSLNGSPVPACKYKFPLDSIASFLAVTQGQSGISFAFDTSFNHKEIVTIASNFITSCPCDLGVMPFTQLTASLSAKGSSKVKTSFTGDKGISNTWCQFLYDNKVSVSPRTQCTLPKDAEGYVYVVITDSATPITLKDDTHIVTGSALLSNGNHGSK